MHTEDTQNTPRRRPSPKVADGRLNVYVAPDARRMVAELATWLYPGRKRTDGLIVERAIRDLYEQTHRRRKAARS